MNRFKRIILYRFRKWFRKTKKIPQKKSVDEILITNPTLLENAIVTSILNIKNIKTPQRFITYDHKEQEIVQLWLSSGQIMYLKFTANEFINMQEENLNIIKRIKKHGKYMGSMDKISILELIDRAHIRIQEKLEQLANDSSNEENENESNCHKEGGEPKPKYIG